MALKVLKSLEEEENNDSLVAIGNVCCDLIEIQIRAT